MGKGSIYKRCGCRNPAGGSLAGAGCPRLKRRDGSWNPRHGTWNYRRELPPGPGGTRRTPIRRGGLDSRDRADAELDRLQELLGIAESDDHPAIDQIVTLVKEAIAAGAPLPDTEQVRRRVRAGADFTRIPTVGEWLETWLAGRGTLAEATTTMYAGHLRNYLIPYLGGIRLDRLSVTHLTDMFEWIEERNEQIREARALATIDRRTLSRIRQAEVRAILAAFKWQKPIGAAGKQRVRSTLRTAINAFITVSQGLITFNPAAHIELPSGKTAKPQIWTDEHVQHWQRTGEIPAPVMVWTPEQTARFLDAAGDDHLHVLFHLLAFYGLRRGEALAVHDTDIDRRARTLTIRWQLSAVAWTPRLKAPKTEAGHRTLPLDQHTLDLIDQQQRRRDTDRDQATTWTESGLLFTDQHGRPLHPQQVSDHFRSLAAQAGLPPIRLHGLRHGTATVLLASGADLKVVQEILGHTQLTTTADLYTSVLNHLTRNALLNGAATINQHRNPAPAPPPARDHGSPENTPEHRPTPTETSG